MCAAIADEDLVARIHAGDRAAETILVERYSRGVLSLVRNAAPQHADDVHQETFRVVLERLRERGIEEPAKLGRFVLRTAKHILLGFQRRAARHPVLALPDLPAEPEDRSPGPSEQVSSEQLAARVREVIAGMPTQRDRTILYLFYIAGIDKAEICAQLSLEPLHFNRVLFRARERFRELVLGGPLYQAVIEE